MAYEIYEWEPGAADEMVAEATTLQDAAEAARACYQAQICSPAWGDGYVTTYADGGAAAKFFGADVPEDAATLVQMLDA